MGRPKTSLDCACACPCIIPQFLINGMPIPEVGMSHHFSLSHYLVTISFGLIVLYGPQFKIISIYHH